MTIMVLSSGSILYLSLCSINVCLFNFRLSDIVAIHVINPTTYGFTEAKNISSPITFTLNLTVTPDTENYLYQVCPPSPRIIQKIVTILHLHLVWLVKGIFSPFLLLQDKAFATM